MEHCGNGNPAGPYVGLRLASRKTAKEQWSGDSSSGTDRN
jgi:hypothetical protein